MPLYRELPRARQIKMPALREEERMSAMVSLSESGHRNPSSPTPFLRAAFIVTKPLSLPCGANGILANQRSTVLSSFCPPPVSNERDLEQARAYGWNLRE